MAKSKTPSIKIPITKLTTDNEELAAILKNITHISESPRKLASLRLDGCTTEECDRIALGIEHSLTTKTKPKFKIDSLQSVYEGTQVLDGLVIYLLDFWISRVPGEQLWGKNGKKNRETVRVTLTIRLEDLLAAKATAMDVMTQHEIEHTAKQAEHTANLRSTKFIAENGLVPANHYELDCYVATRDQWYEVPEYDGKGHTHVYYVIQFDDGSLGLTISIRGGDCDYSGGSYAPANHIVKSA